MNVGVFEERTARETLMEPLVFLEEIVMDPGWKTPPNVDFGTEGQLSCEGDDVVVHLKLGPSLIAGRLFARHCRVGVLGAETASKVHRRLQEGRRYRVRVSDLPFPVNGSGRGLRISIWMEGEDSRYRPNFGIRVGWRSGDLG